MIQLDDLIWVGTDAWSRPTWRHRTTGRHYCTVDGCYDDDPTADARVKALLADGRSALYVKDGGPEGEPSHPVPCTPEED